MYRVIEPFKERLFPDCRNLFLSSVNVIVVIGEGEECRLAFDIWLRAEFLEQDAGRPVARFVDPACHALAAGDIFSLILECDWSFTEHLRIFPLLLFLAGEVRPVPIK